MKTQIVINASPLIAFARMGALDIIGQLPLDFIIRFGGRLGV